MDESFKYDKIEDIEKKLDDILKSMTPKKEDRTFTVWIYSPKALEDFEKAMKNYLENKQYRK